MRRADAVRAPEPTPDSTGTPLVLMGQSAAARRLADEIDAAAEASCVLLEAEGGLDAVAIAREIHARSGRRGPFIVVECGAAEPALVELELFGEPARRGAADLETVAPASALARARGGTLYLGDLAELSAAAQARLARVARDGEVRLGAGDPCRLDVCLIGATSTDPLSEVDEGRLRREVLRHFSRTRVAVPGLRRRGEDVALMIEALMAAMCDEAAVPRKSLTHAAATLLSAMPWRGNLAELRHAVSRLVSDVTSEVIQLEDVLAHVRFDGAVAPHAPAGTLRSARQQFERDYIAHVLQHHRWHVGDAARALGIQRTNLYRKARQLGLSVARPVHHS